MSENPNVVVLVLDSVRADRTSLEDHDRDTTPNLARIADRQDAASFPTAIAHSRYTLPSSASILTGKYPGDHGVGFSSNTLDSSIPTVPKAFRDAGYRTALVSNNHFVGPETGLDRGFDETMVLPDDAMGIVRTVGIGPVAKWVANISQHSAGFEPDKYRHSGAFLMTSLVRQQLETFESQSEPFLLYAHYNQTHRPYYPPLEWFDRYSEEIPMPRSEAGDFSMDVHRNLVEKVAKGCPFSEAEWDTLRALYDAQLEYNDTFIGDLFERISNRFDDTVVVVTGDHGEHLGEHGALGHKYVLDDALLRVPLVTVGLDIPETAAPVQHSDVMRTLLERVSADGTFVDGIDLRSETREFAVSQDGARSLDPIYEVNPDFDAAQFFPEAERSLPQRTAIYTDNYRYVRGDDGTSELVELHDKTGAQSERKRDVIERLDGMINSWLADHQSINDGPGKRDEDLSSETKSRLKNMGYLENEL